MKFKLRKVGNSLVVTIPKELRGELKAGDEIELAVPGLEVAIPETPLPKAEDITVSGAGNIMPPEPNPEPTQNIPPIEV